MAQRSQRPARTVRRALSKLLSQMRRATAQAPEPAVGAWLRHFVKVTRSYWSGLCPCYDVADLPRTNNDLEHLFGSHRYHERRSSGRKRAAPGAAVSGAVRVVSGLATRLRPAEGLRLPKGYVGRWQEIRRELAKPRQAITDGEHVIAQRTLLGYIRKGAGHVHLSELRGFRIWNPLAKGLWAFGGTENQFMDEPRANEAWIVQLHK